MGRKEKKRWTKKERASVAQGGEWSALPPLIQHPLLPLICVCLLSVSSGPCSPVYLSPSSYLPLSIFVSLLHLNPLSAPPHSPTPLPNLPASHPHPPPPPPLLSHLVGDGFIRWDRGLERRCSHSQGPHLCHLLIHSGPIAESPRLRRGNATIHTHTHTTTGTLSCIFKGTF